MAKISASGVVGVLVLLAMVSSSFVVVEAANIDTFNGRSCTGAVTNTYPVSDGKCQNLDNQGAVLISGVSSQTQVTVYNKEGCQAVDQEAHSSGPGCVVQGANALKSVLIA